MLSNDEIYEMAQNCDKWMSNVNSTSRDSLLVGWQRFTSVDRQNFPVFALYPGICVSAACLPGQICKPKDQGFLIILRENFDLFSNFFVYFCFLSIYICIFMVCWKRR